MNKSSLFVVLALFTFQSTASFAAESVQAKHRQLEARLAKLNLQSQPEEIQKAMNEASELIAPALREFSVYENKVADKNEFSFVTKGEVLPGKQLGVSIKNTMAKAGKLEITIRAYLNSNDENPELLATRLIELDASQIQKDEDFSRTKIDFLKSVRIFEEEVSSELESRIQISLRKSKSPKTTALAKAISLIVPTAQAAAASEPDPFQDLSDAAKSANETLKDLNKNVERAITLAKGVIIMGLGAALLTLGIKMFEKPGHPLVGLTLGSIIAPLGALVFGVGLAKSLES